MWQTKTIFRQLQAWLSHPAFERLVAGQQGDWHVHRVSCWSLFLTLLWAQWTGRDSLRDIEAGVDAHGSALAGAGLVSGKRSTIARALHQRPWSIVAGFCLQLASQATATLRIPPQLYSLDATVIDLCLRVFPWAHFRRHKGGIKLHVLWDHQRGVPTLLNLTAANQREFETARTLQLPHGSILCCDRGYLDFAWFRDLSERGVAVITLARAGWTYRVLERRPCTDQVGVTSDQIVVLTGPLSRQKHPGPLRRIRYVDPLTHNVWVILTTHRELPAASVVTLYRQRWQIELFFKWIKRNLKIKAFYGTDYNAVMWQIYAALALYILLALLKQRLRLTWSLFQLQRRLRDHLQTTVPLAELLIAKTGAAT